jgi:hypothetical protein
MQRHLGGNMTVIRNQANQIRECQADHNYRSILTAEVLKIWHKFEKLVTISQLLFLVNDRKFPN